MRTLRARLCGASALLGLGLGTGAAEGQSPEDLVTDRPDQTESAAVVAPGSIQLEAGWMYTTSSRETSEERTHAVPVTLLRIGLARWIEARLAHAGWMTTQSRRAGGKHRDAGLGDVELGVKLHAWKGGGLRPEAALLAAFSVPVGHDAASTGRVDPSFRWAFSHHPRGPLSVGYNLGVSWRTEGAPAGLASRRADGLYTLTVALAVSRRASVYGEGFGLVDLGGRTPARHALDAGGTYLVRPNLQLDISVAVGTSRAAEDWSVGAGAAIRLPR